MSRKITIIGAGSVGSTIAYTLSQDDIANEIVMIDVNRDKAEGEVMDIIQGTCFRDPIAITAGDYEDAKDSVCFGARFGGKAFANLFLYHSAAIGDVLLVVEHLEKYLARNVIWIIASEHELFTVEEAVELHFQEVIRNDVLLLQLRHVLA